jgi:hypothetical protein
MLGIFAQRPEKVQSRGSSSENPISASLALEMIYEHVSHIARITIHLSL